MNTRQILAASLIGSALMLVNHASAQIQLRPRPKAQSPMAATLPAPAVAPVVQLDSAVRLDPFKYVDIRDLAKYPTPFSGTASLIMRQLQLDASRLVGIPNISFYPEGPQGPNGQLVVENGKELFSLISNRSHTLKNTVLNVSIDEIVEEEYDKIFKLRLLMFVHSDRIREQNPSSNGYAFRRVMVRINWHLPRDPEAGRVAMLNIEPEIQLHATQFRVLGDLLSRKVILEDTRHNLRLVFPIAVGAFDIRTGQGMDGNVRLTTQEFLNGKIKKVSAWDTGGRGPNTRARVYPSYYWGRPFIGLLQNGTNYEQIGMHFQITDQLIRGFVSHGCIRVRDKDLYLLDAILNEGTHESLDAHFANSLPGYDKIDHPMPKIDDWYNTVVYSDQYSQLVQMPATQCEDSSYTPRKYGPYYHTVADEDCLTMVAKNPRPAREVTDYMTGLSPVMPQPLYGDGTQIKSFAEGGDAHRERRRMRRCDDCPEVYAPMEPPASDAPPAAWLNFTEVQLKFYGGEYKRVCKRIYDGNRKSCKKMDNYMKAIEKLQKQVRAAM